MTCFKIEDDILLLIEYLSSLKILRSPNYIKNKINAMEHCTDENCDCLEFEYQMCQNQECTSINQTDLMINTEFLSKIEFIIYHNFTRILTALVKFQENANEINTEDLIHYIVNFRTLNATDATELSGSVGYNKGLPIIQTKYIPVNASDLNNNEIKLEYFNSTSSNRIYLPISRNQRCQLSKYHHNKIKFKENKLAKCNLDLSELNQNTTTTSNFTLICLKFQEKIFNYLLHNVTQAVNTTDYSKLNYYVSNLGNPRNNSANWLEIKTIGSQSSANIIGSGDDPNSFVCQNLILNIKYEFYYARMSVGEVRKQHVLTRGNLKFGTKLDLKFNINENVLLPIYYDIMFIDLERNQAEISFCQDIKFLYVICVFYIFKYFQI